MAKKQATKKTKAVIKKEEIKISDKMEQVLVQGNLASLSPEDRVIYYNGLCKSLGLNPLTKPFEYITLNNKLTLYARKDATEQLRKKYGVSVYDYRTETRETVFIYTAFMQDATGRKDIGTGVVTIDGLKGDNLANAIMKAETKAKRRGTLSICGLGMLDECELETIPESAKIPMRSANEVTKNEKTVKQTKLELAQIKMNDLYKDIKKTGLFSEEELSEIKTASLKNADKVEILEKMHEEWHLKLIEREPR